VIQGRLSPKSRRFSIHCPNLPATIEEEEAGNMDEEVDINKIIAKSPPVVSKLPLRSMKPLPVIKEKIKTPTPKPQPTQRLRTLSSPPEMLTRMKQEEVEHAIDYLPYSLWGDDFCPLVPIISPIRMGECRLQEPQSPSKKFNVLRLIGFCSSPSKH
jgi:hypothetical protein